MAPFSTGGTYRSGGVEYHVTSGNEGRPLNYQRLAQELREAGHPQAEAIDAAADLLEAGGSAPPPDWLAADPDRAAYWARPREPDNPPATAAGWEALEVELAAALDARPEGLEPRPRLRGAEPPWESVPCPVPGIAPGSFRTRFYKPPKDRAAVAHLLPRLTPPALFCEEGRGAPADEEAFSHLPSNEYAFQDDLERLGVASAARGEKFPSAEVLRAAAYNTGADALIPGLDLGPEAGSPEAEGGDDLRQWPPAVPRAAGGAGEAGGDGSAEGLEPHCLERELQRQPMGAHIRSTRLPRWTGDYDAEVAHALAEWDRSGLAGEREADWNQWAAFSDRGATHPELHVAQRHLDASHIRGKDDALSHGLRRQEATWYCRMLYESRYMLSNHVAAMAREIDPDERMGGAEFEAFKETGAVFTRYRPQLVTRALYRLAELDLTGERPIEQFNRAKREAEKQHQRLGAVSQYLHERERVLAPAGHNPRPWRDRDADRRWHAQHREEHPVWERLHDADVMRTQNILTVDEIYRPLPREGPEAASPLDELVAESGPAQRRDHARALLPPYLLPEDSDLEFHASMNRRGMGPEQVSGLQKNMVKYTQERAHRRGFFNWHAELRVPTEHGEATAWMLEGDPAGNTRGLWRNQLAVLTSEEEEAEAMDAEKRYVREVVAVMDKWVDDNLAVPERRLEERNRAELESQQQVAAAAGPLQPEAVAFARPPGVDEGAAGAPAFLDFPGSPRGGEEGETPAGEEPTGGEPEGMNFLIGGDDFPSAAGDPGGELDLPSLDDWDDLLGDSA